MGNVRSPLNRKREKSGRYGTDIVSYSVPLTSWTATATVTQALGCPFPPTSSDAYFIEGLSLNMHTAGVDSDGAITLKAQKVRGGSGGTTIDLTATFSVEAAVITTVPTTFEIPLLTTLTPIQLAFLQGDSLIISKVNDSAAIDTQPVGVITAEFAAGA